MKSDDIGLAIYAKAYQEGFSAGLTCASKGAQSNSTYQSNPFLVKLDSVTLHKLEEYPLSDYSEDDEFLYGEVPFNINRLNRGISVNSARDLVDKIITGQETISGVFRSVYVNYYFTYNQKDDNGKTYKLVKNRGIIRLWRSTTPDALGTVDVINAGYNLNKFKLSIAIDNVFSDVYNRR